MPSHPDPVALLYAYDRQLRASLPARLPEGWQVEHDGPLLRVSGSAPTGLILYRDLDGLEGDALDALIARQVDVFAGRGEVFEWKLHQHDLPADLEQRLLRLGFVAGDTETVLIAPSAAAATAVRLAEEVTLREVVDRVDLERIAALESTIWEEDRGWLVDMLEAERSADPDGVAVVVAEVDQVAVSAGWVRFVAGTEFATLWGGSTLPDWRGRGIYRALVAHRAGLALERGFRFLEVDARDTSRPILERLAFLAVTTTTPYVLGADMPS